MTTSLLGRLSLAQPSDLDLGGSRESGLPSGLEPLTGQSQREDGSKGSDPQLQPKTGPEPTRVLRQHPQYRDVYMETSADGIDYLRACDRHQWCSVPTPEYQPRCPLCVAEIEETRGRERYREIHQLAALGQIAIR